MCTNANDQQQYMHLFSPAVLGETSKVLLSGPHLSWSNFEITFEHEFTFPRRAIYCTLAAVPSQHEVSAA